MGVHLRNFGRVPNSWEDFEQTFKNQLDNSQVQIRERYAFLPPNQRPISPRDEGQILLIGRRPFNDVIVSKESIIPGIPMRTVKLSPPQRYALINFGQDASIVRVFAEADVQKIFREQKIALPEPDTLPEREWVASIRRKFAVEKIALAAVLFSGGFAAWFVFRLCNFVRRWARMGTRGITQRA